MQCTHSNQLADVGMFQMNKAEAKSYEEENITIMSMIISSSHSYVGEWGWGVEGKHVGSMDEESQVRGCYNITFICTPTNQETVSVLEKTQANKTFRT